MNLFLEIWLICTRELRRNFRSVKGIALGIISLLGGISFGAIRAIQESTFQKKLGGMQAMDANLIKSQLQDGLEASGYTTDVAKSLVDAPATLVGLGLISIACTPFLASILGFDTIANDIQHRTIRYWTMRTSRPGYLLGKFLGLWISVALVMTGMHVISWLICIFGGVGPASTVLPWGARFLFATVWIAMVWCALVVLISTMFRTSFWSLIVGTATIFVLFVMKLIVKGIEVQNSGEGMRFPLRWLYPNNYDDLLYAPDGKTFFIGVFSLLVFGGLLSAAGTTILVKRDV
jgi:ABC-type transport system involved in multi-copper enzyme maturation permease subunit